MSDGSETFLRAVRTPGWGLCGGQPSDVGASVPNYFYYDGDQRRIITEDSQGRTYFLYDGEKVAVKKNASGTTQAAYVNQGPSIYDPLMYMDRSGAKSYHLANHVGPISLESQPSNGENRRSWSERMAS